MNVSEKTAVSTLLVIISVALSFRLGHFFMLHNNPVADVLVLDSRAYDNTARLILNNELPRTVYFQAPLYPHILAGLYQISNNSLNFVRLVQIIFDVLSVILVFRVTLNLFNRKAAIIAGFMMALYPVLIFHTGLVLKTTLNTFFGAAMVWLVIEKKLKISMVTRLFCLGLLTGWASALQGSVLLQIPFVGLWVVVYSGWKNIRVWVIRGLWLLLGLVLSIGPFTLRNYRVSGRFVLLTSQGGANVYLGNSPYSDGTSKRPPRVRKTPEHEEADFHREAERAVGRKLTPEESSKYWLSESFRWMRDYPVDALMLQLRKLGLFWNRVEIPDNYDFDFQRRYSWFIRYPRYPFWIAGSLGLAGMLFMIGTWRKTWFLYVWMISYCSIWVFFHIYSRYRLPGIAFLIPFAAAFCDRILFDWNNNNYKRLVRMMLAVFIIAFLQALPLTSYTHAQPLFNLGSALYRLGKTDDARKAYLQALDISPGYEPAMVNLGKLAWANGDVNNAVSWWRKTLDIHPDSVEAHSNLGTSKVVRGDMIGAREHFIRATEIQPYYALGWLHLAQTEQAIGNFEAAVSAFDNALELNPDNPQALYGKAMSLEAMGFRKNAVKTWREYLEIAAWLPEEARFVPDVKTRIRILSEEKNTAD
jgi:tetratricopeptide (TPR) repeat protein